MGIVSDQHRLWGEIYSAFEFHRKPRDKDAHSALERVARESLCLSHPICIEVRNCKVWDEELNVDALLSLQLIHKRVAPKRTDGAIVVLVYRGQRVVIDGNNRVNVWSARGQPGPFRAIVIQPREE